MSRSVHTRPPRLLAPIRLRAPRERRGARDPGDRDRAALRLKDRGVAPESPALPTSPVPQRLPPLPRIQTTKPRPCHLHPAGRPEIAALLRASGAHAWYGLRAVLLTRGGNTGGPRLAFGRLRVPGVILLYDQPAPPWTLPGRLPDAARGRLLRAGAEIHEIAGGVQSVVEWPREMLRDFMLHDVLLHELGHHVVQQYTGKRGVRVMRTREHEAFAERFAARTRAALGVRGDG